MRRMKSYLSLVPISARVRRRQNRMTILCIIFAVFLVTAIFSVADMMIRTQSSLMTAKHGNWHISLKQVPRDVADEIGARSDVTAAGLCLVYNYEGTEPYRMHGKRVVLYGTDEVYMRQITHGVTAGVFPENDDEILLSPNAAAAFGAQAGSRVTLHTPAGDKTFTVSGFGTDDKAYYANQTYLVGVYMTQSAFTSLMEQNGVTDTAPVYYVQFQDAAKAARAITELQSSYQLSEENIAENTAVLGMAGQSRNESMKNFYGIAAILFILVLLAGVLMISGSMNSNVAQRTQFFGMMRCIGASRQQIIRFVRLEALNWCKTAVPAGILLGTAVSWGICAALRFGIGGEFATTPVGKLSPAGLICGALVGVVTVLLAAQSPARRAAKVSPMCAVSGNTENTKPVHRAIRTGFGRIDCLLGVHHAAASKKNLFLMTASFALCIILFLSFSTVMDLAGLLMPGQNPISADLVLNSYDNALTLKRRLVASIKEIEGVENAYGSNYRAQVPAACSRTDVDAVNIVSYDETLLNYAKESVVGGELTEIYGNSNCVATVYNKDNPLQIGDTITIAGIELTVSCALSQGLFGDDLIVICSQENYDRLFGAENYCLIGVQLGKDATEETLAEIRHFENDAVIVLDERANKQENNATYLASRIVVYSFLAIIGMITLFNIINSLSMSVSARTKQYGAMRAVGMDGRQLIRMISAEAFTYAFLGLLFGLGTGIPLSRSLHETLITRHFGILWRPPVVLLGIVIIFVLACAGTAVYTSCRRLGGMVVTESINEL